MNKVLIGVIVVIVVAGALATASFVYAQTATPQAPLPGTGYGYGRMMGGRGMMAGAGTSGAPGYGMGANGVEMGFMHDDMIAAYAEKLGLSVDEINARLAKGETMAQIASSKGLTLDQFRTIMLDARSLAIDQAVIDGTLTQAQADWMKQRGAGMVNGGGMMRRQGQSGNPGCPFFNDPQSK